jgi:hypothetical protein
MVMQMTKILDCSVAECVYNKNKQCHTMAITVGSECPMCDTFENGGSACKGGVDNIEGGIGACRQDDCKFNQSLECRAPGIHVGKHGGHADCETFTQR